MTSVATTAAAKSSLIENVTWPDALPPTDDYFFSISCGNSWIRWAFHFSIKGHGQPALFWRTMHIQEDNLEDGRAMVEYLFDHLPKKDTNSKETKDLVIPAEYIFGKGCPPSYEAALAESGRRGAKVNFYIVSSNESQVNLLSKIISSVPSNIFLMKGNEFFPPSKGFYSTMGMDRAAALSGAAHIYGYPALVFDGGTALTYTAADADGKIIGGGISPGISLRLQSMGDGTAALPDISIEKFKDRLQAIVDSGKPFPTFATNTEDAMIVNVLSEVAQNARYIVKKWLQKVGTPSPSKKGKKINTKRVVMVTGGTADLIAMLLGKKYGKLIETIDKDDFKIEVMKMNNLIHFGVTDLLLQQAKKAGVSEAPQNKEEKSPKKHSNESSPEPPKKKLKKPAKPKMKDYANQRVAKDFDGQIYFGEVKSNVKSSSEYGSLWHIVYEDDDEEDMDEQEVLAAIALYKKEKKN